MKRVNTRHIKAKYGYSIPELAYTINRHPNTILAWIKNEGLQRMEGIYPYRVWGEVVIEFLNIRQNRKIVKLATNEFRCCKCQVPRKASEGRTNLHFLTSKAAMLKAKCEQCGTVTCKIISLKNLPEIVKTLIVATQQEAALVQSTNSNAYIETQGATRND